MNNKEWKKDLMKILKEHPDVGEKMTGRVEINMNDGGVSRIFIFSAPYIMPLCKSWFFY
jgi:hypothetical protein